MAFFNLEDLLRQEDAHVEWKKGVAEIEEVVRTLTAFANDLDGSGLGGWVVCGVEERRDEHGFPAAHPAGLAGSRFQEVEGTVLDWCRNRVSPPLFPSIEVVKIPDDASRRILVFHVEASGRVHSFQEKDGRTRSWVRHGSKTVVANKEVLRQLQERKREVPPFLDRPCSRATLDDLDLVIAGEFLRRANLPHPPEEYLKPGAQLDAFSSPLVLASGTRAVPTYLALLLFSREPTRWIPGAQAIFAVYPGEERTEALSTRFQATAPLPSLIRDLLDRLQLYTGISIDKTRSALEIRQNRPRYSLKALQEAVVNAFAHRDYESHEPVRITVFSDRIEIASPGGAVLGMDPERLRRGEATPVWRNPALASFLLKLELAQNQGQGLKTILAETRATAGRDPQILPSSTEFEVKIPAFRPVPLPLGSTKNGETGGQGLILISVGGDSIRPVVEHSLPELGLQGAEILVDFASPDYIKDLPRWEAEAVKIRDSIRTWVEDPHYSRLHLFYRGPVAIAPLLGALITPAKPLVVYHYEDGRYAPAYTLDRRFLIGRD